MSRGLGDVYKRQDWEVFSPIFLGAGVDVGAGVAVTGGMVGVAVGATVGTTSSAFLSDPHPASVNAIAVPTANTIFLDFLT